MFFLTISLKYFSQYFVKVLTETPHTNIRGEQITPKRSWSLVFPLSTTYVQGLAVWRGAQARCDFAEALRFPAVLQCGAQQILQILLMLLPSH